jgi:hypothetical protein
MKPIRRRKYVKAADLKRTAWFIATVLTSLGLTVLAGTPWGAFCTHVATAIGFGMGVTGPKPELDPESEDGPR